MNKNCPLGCQHCQEERWEEEEQNKGRIINDEYEPYDNE